MTPYQRLEQRRQAGGIVVLDGGIGSEIERLGFPRDRNIGELWGIRAVYEQPDRSGRRIDRRKRRVVPREHGAPDSVHRVPGVHEARGRMGRESDTCLLVFGERDKAREFERFRVRRVQGAVHQPFEPRDGGKVLKRRGGSEARQEILEARAVIVEARLDFPGYETLIATGLPLWVAYRWTATGPSDTRRVGIEPHAGTWQAEDGELFGRAAARFEELGVGAILVNCLPRDDVPGTLPYLRRFTSLPLGAYPNVGLYLDPGWQHDESTTPEAYLEDARGWVAEGATIVGGCCGTTPDHIAALARELRATA